MEKAIRNYQIVIIKGLQRPMAHYIKHPILQRL